MCDSPVPPFQDLAGGLSGGKDWLESVDDKTMNSWKSLKAHADKTMCADDSVAGLGEQLEHMGAVPRALRSNENITRNCRINAHSLSWQSRWEASLYYVTVSPACDGGFGL